MMLAFVLILYLVWLAGLTWYVLQRNVTPARAEQAVEVIQEIARQPVVVELRTKGRERLRAILKAKAKAARR